MFSFVGTHLSFYPKDVCSFSVFYLKEKELNQKVCLIKYAENEISNPTSHKKIIKKRERERGVKTQSNFKNSYKTPEKFLLVTLITNYHKLSLLPLVVRH